MIKYLLILAALAVCYESPAPASPLKCEAAGTPFTLIRRDHTLWVELADGQTRGLIINPELSSAHETVAAISMVAGSTSIILEDDGDFTQTFLPRGGQPVFVYGECR